MVVTVSRKKTDKGRIWACPIKRHVTIWLLWLSHAQQTTCPVEICGGRLYGIGTRRRREFATKCLSRLRDAVNAGSVVSRVWVTNIAYTINERRRDALGETIDWLEFNGHFQQKWLYIVYVAVKKLNLMRQLKMQNWNHYNEELCSVVFITDEPVDKTSRQ